jgi:hypothetical protein
MRYDFTFNDLGEFNVMSTNDNYRPKHYVKMDMYGMPIPQSDFDIIEDGDGHITVYAPDSWTEREVDYMVLDFFNARARKLCERISILDKAEGV